MNDNFKEPRKAAKPPRKAVLSCFAAWRLCVECFKKLFISAIICISVVSVWLIRNYMVLDANQVVLTTSSGAVMAKGWNKDVPRLHTNTKGDLADETLVLKDYSFNEKKSRNEVARMNLYKDATLDFIKTNPDLIFPIIGKKLIRAVTPFP